MPVGETTVPRLGLFAKTREDWLSLVEEDIIDPDRPIIDPHLHLWNNEGDRYMLDEAISDMTSGHNVVATVYVECNTMYRTDGPEEFRPVGEIEFASNMAAMNAKRGDSRIALCAGIVGNADLTLGEGVRAVLEAEIGAANGLFRGIRHAATFDLDPVVTSIYPNSPQGLLHDSNFREGFRCLASLGLTFDAWLYHPQLRELSDLAKSSPHNKIVLDHCGGPIGVGIYANRRDEIFADWKQSIQELAGSSNVYVKLGGIALRFLDYDFDERPMPPSSEQVATVWRPYIETCIEAFGPDRCMFESNFPPDKGQCSYQVLFNAFKRIASQYSEEEKNALFYDTAASFYDLDLQRTS